jgi:hypothetical protein
LHAGTQFLTTSGGVYFLRRLRSRLGDGRRYDRRWRRIAHENVKRRRRLRRRKRWRHGPNQVPVWLETLDAVVVEAVLILESDPEDVESVGVKDLIFCS